MVKENKIDLVIPYVNNQDQEWRKTYLDYAFKHRYYSRMASMNGLRYANDIDLISYQLKLVEKNMPWINKIYLLLSNKGQEPSYIPHNCEIVYHKDFIPLKYLPTFNSCTIEMFLWNIPNLSERFIYANDDMLPIKPLKPSDFFYYGKIRMNFEKETLSRETKEFRWQCYNSYRDCVKIENNTYSGQDFEYPWHSMTPMILSDCKECFEKMKNYILPNIRGFRNEFQHNQYIYPIFNKLYRGCCDSKIKFYYSHLDEQGVELVEKLKETQIICVNATKDKKNTRLLKEYLDKLCE